MMFVYSTSHRIEVAGPGRLRKDLHADALIGEARDAKPALVHDASREPAVYRQILGPAAIGPRCFESGSDWVVLEQLDAPPLWQVGDWDTWIAVAGWVAVMHRRLASVPPGDVPLTRHNASLLASWRERAATASVGAVVLAAHERASARLVDLPATTVHGDLYPSNVLVRAGVAGIEVWPVDWELAGVGPAVLDVAALTAGRLPPATRVAMARAYFDATGGRRSAWPAWCADLDAARLHLCVQWLGWAPGWTPPAEHQQDWLGEATDLASRL